MRRARQLWGLFCTLFVRSAWAQPSTVLVGTTGDGAALESVRSLGVGSSNHCGGHDRRGRCFSRVRSIGVGSGSHHCGGRDRCRRCSASVRSVGVGAATHWWRAVNIRTLLWPLIVRSSWDQPVTSVSGMIGKGAALASICSVGVGSAATEMGDTTFEGAALASVRLVGMGSAS